MDTKNNEIPYNYFDAKISGGKQMRVIVTWKSDKEVQ